jgi:hypothetical protein
MIHSSSQNSLKADAPITNFQRLSTSFKFVWGRTRSEASQNDKTLGYQRAVFIEALLAPMYLSLRAPHGFDYAMNLRRKTSARYRKRQVL